MTHDDSTFRPLGIEVHENSSASVTTQAIETEPSRPSTWCRDNRKAVATAFGCVMRGFRLQKGLSQEEVALLGDFDRTYPSLLERGLRTPTLTFIFDLALVLEVHPTMLVGSAFEEYRRRVGLAQPGATTQTASIQPAASCIETRGQRGLTTASIQRWVKNRVPLRALRDPLRAIGILEATLNGETIKHCSDRLGLTPARCDQLTRLAAVLLLQPKFVLKDEIPPHDWSRARKRFANRALWLRLIERARNMIRGELGVECSRNPNEQMSSAPESSR